MLVKKDEKKIQTSSWKPKKAKKEATLNVLADLQIGQDIHNHPWPEFNNRSITEEINVNQKAFNTYIEAKSDDPDMSWRAQTKRPIVHNKLMTIVAHVTASILYPMFMAQNPNDEEDRAAAEVMRLLVMHQIQNSEYDMKFLGTIMQMVVEPAGIMSLEINQVMQKIKMRLADGTIEIKEAIDEVLSGLQMYTVDINDFFWTNMYEPNIQKQRAVAWRWTIDYQTAQAMYGHHKDFKYVRPGIRTMWDDENKTFYDQQDDNLTKKNQVEVFRYWNRLEDLYLVFVNGVLVTEADNMNPRFDKLYPFAKSGYQPLKNGNFFLYKSAANKVLPDEKLINTLYNMVMDGTFLSLMPPVAIYGQEELSGNIYVPGTQVNLRDPNSKIESLAPRSDIRAGMMASEMVERSITESTQDSQRAGVGGGGEKTAREAIILEENATKALGIFAKMIGDFVTQIGNLLQSDVLQHMTTAQIADLLSPDQRLKYSSYMVKDVDRFGKETNVRIEFTDEDFNREEPLTPEEELKRSFEIQKREGGYNTNNKIYVVNPLLFKNRKYKAYVRPDFLERKSKQIERALNLEAYDRLIGNPTVKPQEITRDFLLEQYRPGESDKYLVDPEMPGMAPTAGGSSATGVNQNMTSQVTGSNSLKSLLESDANA